MRLTPDGVRYLQIAGGIDQPMPFKLRRGLPQLCRTSETRWVIANVVSMLYASVGIGVLASQHGASLGISCLASVLFLGLPWVRFCAQCPVLVDMPALMFAVLAAVAFPHSQAAGLLLAFAGAYVSERVPVWAALYAWNPIFLLALVVPVFNFFMWRTGDVEGEGFDGFALRHPVRASRMSHARQWLSPAAMILPWGACLVAIFNPSWWLLAAVAAGYAQLLVATDTVRLYQQAAPVVCVAAAMAFPAGYFVWLAPVLVASHLLNPWSGDGV